VKLKGGVKSGVLPTLNGMSEQTDPSRPDDVLDRFVGELLEAGAVLSQIVSQMARFDAAFDQTPDAVPIPQAAHELLFSVLAELKPRHSSRDWKVAAAILKEATATICNDVFFVRLDDQ
jgi:hypothetical protein